MNEIPDHTLKVEMGEFTTYRLTCNLDDAAECHLVCVTHPDGHDDMPDEEACVKEVYRNGCVIAEWVNDGGIESVGFTHTVDLPVNFYWDAGHDSPIVEMLKESPAPMNEIDREALTDERVAAIQERLDKATPGPWESVWVCIDEEVVIEREGVKHDDEHMTLNDADFIANAREDIPFLLAEIERLKGR